MRRIVLIATMSAMSTLTGCGDEPCSSHADCDGGYACDFATGGCNESCSGATDCKDEYFCGGKKCVADLDAGGTCGDDSACGPSMHCENGRCCGQAATCCASDLDCDGDAAGSTCVVAIGTCAPSCAGEGKESCAPGHHCDALACVMDSASGGTCDEDSDCAPGLACGGGVCCAGAACCASDGDCAGGFGCSELFACATSCSSDADCGDAFHCEGTACVADHVKGGFCNGDDDCAGGATCTSGTCCEAGGQCCGDDTHCATLSPGYRCDVAALECFAGCSGDGANCAAGYHCDDGACVEDRLAGTTCDETDDCAGDDQWCNGGVCCANGEDCCDDDDDCGTCNKCDRARGVCVLQAANEDVKEECNESAGSCQAGTCSGTASECGVKPMGADCGTCQSCNADGACQSNSTDHQDCGECRKCSSGSCVVQTTTEDLKNECRQWACDDMLYGMDAGACKTYATSTAANTGLCTGAGACPTLASSCTGAGATAALSCADSRCFECPAQGFEADYAGTNGACNRDFDQLGCDAGFTCGPAGACLDTCSSDSDCGVCQKCDQSTRTCVLQSANEDVKNECEPQGTCNLGYCSGTSAACGKKPTGADCGTCRTCDASGTCMTNSADHQDCEECYKCDAGACVLQAGTEDLKNDCELFTCGDYVNAYDAGECRAYASSTAANTGLCSGTSSSCAASPTSACTGSGSAVAYECDADPRCTICPNGELASEISDSRGDTCERDYARMGCPVGQACGPLGTCELARSCREIHDQSPTSPDGLYTVDADGTGPNQAMQVYCDMTTDGGGWTLVANRLPFADANGMAPLTTAVGTYASAQRGASFQIPIEALYRRATSVVFASRTGGTRCNDGNLTCYDNVLKVALSTSTTKQYSPACTSGASGASAEKLRGVGAGATTGYLCGNSLGWGNCGSRACHFGSADTSISSDGPWTNGAPAIHVPSADSSYADDAACRICNGGTTEFCCNNDDDADAVFTIWLR